MVAVINKASSLGGRPPVLAAAIFVPPVGLAGRALIAPEMTTFAPNRQNFARYMIK
jgi:hypothetical protein